MIDHMSNLSLKPIIGPGNDHQFQCSKMTQMSVGLGEM